MKPELTQLNQYQDPPKVKLPQDHIQFPDHLFSDKGDIPAVLVHKEYTNGIEWAAEFMAGFLKGTSVSSPMIVILSLLTLNT